MIGEKFHVKCCRKAKSFLNEMAFTIQTPFVRLKNDTLVLFTLDNALPAALLPLAIIWSLLTSLVILQLSDTILLEELSPEPKI